LIWRDIDLNICLGRHHTWRAPDFRKSAYDSPRNERPTPRWHKLRPNLRTINIGHRDHRQHIPLRGTIVSDGTAEPTLILTNQQPLAPTINAQAFDTRQRGLITVRLEAAALR
jgi:hypothetical protein